jgi:hypothetical protein
VATRPPDAPRVNEHQASHDTDSARADAIAPNAATDRRAQNGAIRQPRPTLDRNRPHSHAARPVHFCMVGERPANSWVPLRLAAGIKQK